MSPFFVVAMLLAATTTWSAARAAPVVQTTTQVVPLTTADIKLHQGIIDSQGRVVYCDWAVGLFRIGLDGQTKTLSSIDCYGVTEDSNQNLYIPSYGSLYISKIDTSNNDAESTFCSTVGQTQGIVYHNLTNALFVSESSAVKKIDIATQVVTTVASDNNLPNRYLCINRNGSHIYVGGAGIFRITVATGAVDVLLPFTTWYASGFALSLNETVLFVAGRNVPSITTINFCTGDMSSVGNMTGNRGLQQYCYPSTGICGIVYMNNAGLYFVSIEDNTTSLDYSCALPKSITERKTASPTITWSPSKTNNETSDSGTPSPTETLSNSHSKTSESLTPSPTETLSNSHSKTSESGTPSPTETLSNSHSNETSASASRTATHTKSTSRTKTHASMSPSFTHTSLMIAVGSGSWGATAGVIAAVTVGITAGAVVVGIVALKSKAAAAAAAAASNGAPTAAV